MKTAALTLALVLCAAGLAQAQSYKPRGFAPAKPQGFAPPKPSPFAKPAPTAVAPPPVYRPKAYAPIAPTVTPPDAGAAFKPFKGTHTSSDRGGVNPYPAPAKPKGGFSTY
jgi:hypothetical protein